MTLGFYFRYASRALLRDGQRTLLAVLCITFGVMSLVAMQMLAGVIKDAVVTDPRAALGGDVMFYRSGQVPFTPKDVASIAALQSEGTIGNYTLAYRPPARWLKPAGSGQVYVITGQVLGVDAASFPLVGQIHLREEGLTFAQAIKQPLDAVITSDMADQLKLNVGDSFTLLGGPTGAPSPLRVSAVADDVPGARGSSVYFSRETAGRMSGQMGSANMVYALWGSHGEATSKLDAGGWAYLTSGDMAKDAAQASDLFGFALKGAGILGLFVGGIGVANTLQVVLARRMLEIATLKTLGYRRRDLLALFGIETALLGLIGGVAGVLIALGLSLLLANLFAQTGAILLHWRADPLILAGGVLLGMVTAVIFGLYTIVRSSSVRPAVLLRDLPVKPGWGARIAGFGLLLVLLALVTGISVLVMGKLMDGLGVVAGALVGLVVLTLLFGGALLAVLSLPTPGLPMLTMARRNLRRRPMRSVFALIALFMGVFAIGLASTVILNARGRLSAREASLDGQNLTVYAKQADASQVTAQLSAQGVQDVHSSLGVPVSAQASSTPLPMISYLDGRTGQNATWDVTVVEGQWTGAATDALAPADLQKTPFSLKLGDNLQVRAPGGGEQTFRLSGFYQFSTAGDTKSRGALLVNRDTAAKLGDADSVLMFTGQAPANRLVDAGAALGRALPQASVITLEELNRANNRIFDGLFAFAVGLAGLALVAGAILIANAVGLAMVERRREMGILKAVGFTAGRVLSTLLVENAVLGLLGGLLGMIAVIIAVAYVNTAQPQAELSIDPLLFLTMVGVSVALALLSAWLVAWRPTHIRPLEVLRNE